jgi:hypothetical protein
MSANDSSPQHEAIIPPTPDVPYWRLAGCRASFAEVIVACPGRAAELRERHLAGTSAIQRAGIEAHARGHHAEGRLLLANAARLCHEPDGHFPAASLVTDA